MMLTLAVTVPMYVYGVCLLLSLRQLYRKRGSQVREEVMARSFVGLIMITTSTIVLMNMLRAKFNGPVQ